MEAKEKWVRITLSQLPGHGPVKLMDGSDPAAILEGMARLVEECAGKLGLDVHGVICRLTVILLADKTGGNET